MHLRQPTKCFYAVRQQLIKEIDAKTPEEKLWQEIILCALMDYYHVGCAQKKGDYEDAEDYLFRRMWWDNFFGLDKDWVTVVIRRGKEKADHAWVEENRRLAQKNREKKKRKLS